MSGDAELEEAEVIVEERKADDTRVGAMVFDGKGVNTIEVGDSEDVEEIGTEDGRVGIDDAEV
jgi:hypothetical protein